MLGMDNLILLEYVEGELLISRHFLRNKIWHLTFLYLLHKAEQSSSAMIARI
jgi:hypothetical protein